MNDMEICSKCGVAMNLHTSSCCKNIEYKKSSYQQFGYEMVTSTNTKISYGKIRIATSKPYYLSRGSA